jgi:hypothetical protein
MKSEFIILNTQELGDKKMEITTVSKFLDY